MAIDRLVMAFARIFILITSVSLLIVPVALTSPQENS